MFDSPQDLYGDPEFSQALQVALENPEPSSSGGPSGVESDRSDPIGARLVQVAGEKPAYGFGFEGSLDGIQGYRR